MANQDPANFGFLLRRERLAAGLTQEALAERAGLSPKAVSDLERDPARRPRLATVTLLADALGMAPERRAELLAAARPQPVPPVDPAAADAGPGVAGASPGILGADPATPAGRPCRGRSPP